MGYATLAATELAEETWTGSYAGGVYPNPMWPSPSIRT
jgi:hypothetical protein